MSGYYLTPRALKDLDQIADYSLIQWGERQTEKYLGEMAKCFERLGRNPDAGRTRDDIGDGYRSYRQGSHMIFYVVVCDAIAIIGIPHGSMDIHAYFETPE